MVALANPDHIWHTNAWGLLESLQSRNTSLLISSLALNEVIYQLLYLEKKVEPPAEESETLPTWNRWPDRVNENILKLSNLKIFEPPGLDFHRQTIKGVTEWGLDPTDAFHYAAAHSLNCPIITNDAGFQKIPDQNLVIVTFY